MNTNNHLTAGNKNKFRKLLIVAFAVTVLMLTAGVASAMDGGGSMWYHPGWNLLRVEGYTYGYCDPAANCYGGYAEVEMKLYANGVQIGHANDATSTPGGDDMTYAVSIQYDLDNPNFANHYTATLEHWGYLDGYGSYHEITNLSYP